MSEDNNNKEVEVPEEPKEEEQSMSENSEYDSYDSESEEEKPIPVLKPIEEEGLDEETTLKIKKLEKQCDRWLWYPDDEKNDLIRCKACVYKVFHSQSAALEHIQSHDHHKMVRKYREDRLSEKTKKENEAKDLHRKEKWINRKKAAKKQKKAEKLKSLTPEEIEKRKQKFQEKKQRRLARKNGTEVKSEEKPETKTETKSE
ncbi:hypothetical protein WA158_008254 [Blastocystis sp. Blastoise]